MTNAGATRRLADMKIKQKELAERLGVTTSSFQSGLYRGNGRYLAIVDLLEIMSEAQRNVFFGIEK
jgi:transcriptional regulator with XRE-family HTH domain